MSSERKFCYMPWIFSQVNSAGRIRVCPSITANQKLSSQKLSPMFHQVNSPAEILNSEQNKKIRAEMLKGKLPLECTACEVVERNGGTSLRLAVNSGMSKTFDSEALIANTAPNGFLHNPEINYLELRLGRVCNLRCRFCHPRNSSAWDLDYKKLYGINFKGSENEGALQENWHDTPQFENWFRQVSTNLKILQFVGGEPLLSSSHEKILQILIAAGVSEKVSLLYTTNGTVISEELFSLWSRFKSTQIFVSVEGIGKIYEYQRWPAKWSEVEGNIKRLAAEVGRSITKLTIQPHLNIYNAYNIDQLMLWCLESDPKIGWSKHLNLLVEPACLSPFILSELEKTQVHQKWSALTELIEKKYTALEKHKYILAWIESAKKSLYNHDWTHRRAESQELNAKLDKIRNIEAKNFLDEFTLAVLCAPS